MQSKKKKQINWTSPKLKTFAHQKAIQKVKRQPTGEKTFANHMSNRNLYPDYIKNTCNSTIKRQTNQFFKGESL